MSSEELRWGIIGCGLISHDFVLSMKNCKTKNKIVAVAARNLEKAENFKTQTNLENSVVVYGSYDELLADKNVDIVYIGVVNHEHVPIGIKALEVGKPLLAEKPIGPNVKEAKKLFEKAKEKNLFLMEATWSRFFPVYREIRKIIDEKTLGNVVGVNATFCLPWLSENRFWPDKGQTALTDIGSYVVQFAIWAFKERPLKITAVGKTTENGSDLWASIVLEFSNGGKATLMYSCVDHSPNSAVISLSEGYIQIPEFFWCPERLIVHKGPLTWKEPLPKPQEFLLNDDDGNYNFNNSSGLRYEIDHVHECLKKNLKQSPIHNFDESLKTLEILDEIRRQIGVVYGQD